MIKKHFASYRYAMRGIEVAFRSENNMIVHLTAGVVVVAANYLLHVTATEWLITLMLIGLSWAAEIFNTAIEKLADRISQEHDPLIGQAKDLAAGGVLVISVLAVICAAIIYLPYVV